MVVPLKYILSWPVSMVRVCLETVPGTILLAMTGLWTLVGLLVLTSFVAVNYLIAVVVIYLIGLLCIYASFKAQRLSPFLVPLFTTGIFWAVAGRLIWWFIFRV